MGHQPFAPGLSPIFLLSLLVLCVPLAWAQRTILAKQTPILSSESFASRAAVPEAQMRPSSLRAETPLTFMRNLGQTEPRPRFTARGGRDGIFLMNKRMGVVELGAKANYSIANVPPPWLVNVPRSVHHRTVYTRNLQYYGQRAPLVGRTILRIARQASNHPRIARVLGIISPKF